MIFAIMLYIKEGSRGLPRRPMPFPLSTWLPA